MRKLNNKIIILLGGLAVLVIAFVNINSVMGRLFIWKNILNNLDKVSWSGLGQNAFKLHYAAWQAEYFSRNQAWSTYHLVADAPSFAFNEVLHFYVEYGIAAVFLLSLLIYFNVSLLVRSKHPILRALGFSNISIFIFAMVSYPLHSIWVLLLLASNHILMIAISFKRSAFGLTATSVLLCYVLVKHFQYTRFEQVWVYADSLPINASLEKGNLFDSAYSSLYNNQYFLNSYCSFLLNEQRPDEALAIGSVNKIYFNQYQWSLLMGTAYLQKNEIYKAEAHFIYGHNIIPNRFIPLYYLLDISKASQDTLRIRNYARKILSTPIKVPSPIVTKIKGEAYMLLRTGRK